MAFPVYLFLTANGNEIQGESSVTSLGRENSIECLYFYFSGMMPTSTSAGGAATGKRRYDPIRIQKVIDKSSPLLLPRRARVVKFSELLFFVMISHSRRPQQPHRNA